MDPALHTIAARLQDASRLLFITGAGLSADSGLPTYRGVGGLYDDADTEEGLPIEEVLSGHMFRRRPKLTWRHILEIERACRGARPNRGHEVIAALEATHDVTVLTQNIDGLHLKAGSTQIIDIHGDVHHLTCTRCDWRETVDDYEGFPELPTCPTCGAVIRPEVVLFGEMLDGQKLHALQTGLAMGYDLIFSVGTSSLFPYIAMPVVEGRHHGALTVEINPGDTEVSRAVHHKIRAGAAETLDALHQLTQAR